MEMEMEIESHVNNHDQEELNRQKTVEKLFPKGMILLLNCALLSIGNTGGPLLLRLYFIRGGKRVWLSCWLESGGWPIMLIPLLASYVYRVRKSKEKAKLFFLTPFLFISGAVLGVLTGVDDWLYAYGVSKLPVSTFSLIVSTHVGFTAGFAFLIVKQKFTSYSINTIFLLTVAAVVLGVHTSSDRPNGISNLEYFTGFFMTLGASALYGFVLPMVEFTYKKSKTKLTYTLVIEMQMIMSLFATAFCTIGMIAIPREAKEYELGETKYYTVLVFNAIVWQFFFLGAIGIIFSASSLLSGIMIAILLPITETLAVAFYHEKFSPEKGISLALSLWAFVSYFYGDYKQTKQLQQSIESKTNIANATNYDVSA
ncbi:Purine permease [Thalictrum thalictroides]|uniref:Probable purine permease n=1 Tax=Thalictrum thalictroides TaxID=46969 RepID=A0A7J6VRA1_THATH|nr:Purine permease [Thalictrum thalictroides]